MGALRTRKGDASRIVFTVGAILYRNRVKTHFNHDYGTTNEPSQALEVDVCSILT